MQSLVVEVCNSPEDATTKGFSKLDKYKSSTGLKLNKVVVVKGGTQSGKSTVDLLLEDEAGKEYVCLVTSSLLKSVPHFE